MNQNRNNNRRRGRGGNRGQGGGNQGNRIDSRARGNAPQMLEKYRKLAHDASLNGDRVQTEYYLQFADHYFRVVADTRAQRDDQQQRPRREFERDEREPQSSGDYGYDYEDEGAEDGRQANGYAPRRERSDEPVQEGEPALEGERADEAADANPFVREDRGNRNRGGRGPRRQDNREPADRGEPEAEPAGFDAALLPPSIAREEEAPRPRRARRPRKDDDDAGNEAVEAFG